MIKQIKTWLPLLCALFVFLAPVDVKAADIGLPEDVDNYLYYFVVRENDGIYRCYMADYPIYVYGSDTSFSVYLSYGKFDTSVYDVSMEWSEPISNSVSSFSLYLCDGSRDNCIAYLYGGYDAVEFVTANFDVYSISSLDAMTRTILLDEVFFLAPRPTLAPIAEQMNLSQVTNQILLLIPIVIVAMVGFLALRKGLALLQQILHQA